MACFNTFLLFLKILKLPKFSKMACFKLLNDIKTLKNSIYRLSLLKKYNFENDAYNELLKIIAQSIFIYMGYKKQKSMVIVLIKLKMLGRYLKNNF